MASPVKLYQKEMHDNLGFFATWLPGDPIEIGDIGVLEGGRFRRMASLKELGIECQVAEGDATQDVQYTSSQGTKVTASASAAMTAVAKGEISIEFSREGAFVFQASELRPMRMDNRVAVGQQLLEAYNKGTWQIEWLLIESLHVAKRGTIIVSEDSSAGLVLAASADVPIPTISLADPKVGLTVASTRGKLVHIIGGTGLRPLYSCLHLTESWLGKTSVQPVRGLSRSGGEVPLSRPGIDLLLNS